MKSLRNALAALALLATCLGFGGASFAQAGDTDRLGVEVAHEMFTAMDFADVVRQGAANNTSALEAIAKVRPEWKGLMLQSLEDAVAKDLPSLEAVLGRHLTKTMNKDELTAALTVFRDPQARAMFAAYAHHQTPPGNASKPCAAECMRAMASPAGRSFLTKLQTAFGPEAQAEMMAAIVPDMFIGFGEKAKAAEAKRANP